MAEEARLAEESRQACREEKLNVQAKLSWVLEKNIREILRLRRAEEEARVEEERRLADEARLTEKTRLAEEARLEQLRLAEGLRLAEERRLAEEALLAEKARVADEHRLAEEARLAEKRRLAEEARRAKKWEAVLVARDKSYAKIQQSAIARKQLGFRIKAASRLLQVLEAHHPDDPNKSDNRAMLVTLEKAYIRNLSHPFPPVEENYRDCRRLAAYEADIWRRYGDVLRSSGEDFSIHNSSHVKNKGSPTDRYDKRLVEGDARTPEENVLREDSSVSFPVEAGTDSYKAGEEVRPYANFNVQKQPETQKKIEAEQKVESIPQVEIKATDSPGQLNVSTLQEHEAATSNKVKNLGMLDNSSKLVSVLREEDLITTNAALKEDSTAEKRLRRHRGIFHRLTYSKAPLYRRRVRIQRTSTSARLKLPCCPKRLVFRSYAATVMDKLPFHFVIAAQRHHISIPCHGKCSLANVLFQRDTVFRGRLKLAFRILKKNGSRESHGLLGAYKRACAKLPRVIKTTFEEYGEGWVDETPWFYASDLFW